MDLPEDNDIGCRSTDWIYKGGKDLYDDVNYKHTGAVVSGWTHPQPDGWIGWWETHRFDTQAVMVNLHGHKADKIIIEPSTPPEQRIMGMKLTTAFPAPEDDLQPTKHADMYVILFSPHTGSHRLDEQWHSELQEEKRLLSPNGSTLLLEWIEKTMY